MTFRDLLLLPVPFGPPASPVALAAFRIDEKRVLLGSLSRVYATLGLAAESS